MAKTKAEKSVIIDKLEEAFKTGASSVFVHFTKITVAEESAMRRALRTDGVSYFVAKKTLMRRALEKLGHAHETLPLEGEVAVAYGGGEDSTVAARLRHEFGEKLPHPPRRSSRARANTAAAWPGARRRTRRAASRAGTARRRRTGRWRAGRARAPRRTPR